MSSGPSFDGLLQQGPSFVSLASEHFRNRRLPSWAAGRRPELAVELYRQPVLQKKKSVPMTAMKSDSLL